MNRIHMPLNRILPLQVLDALLALEGAGGSRIDPGSGRSLRESTISSRIRGRSGSPRLPLRPAKSQDLQTPPGGLRGRPRSYRKPPVTCSLRGTSREPEALGNLPFACHAVLVSSLSVSLAIRYSDFSGFRPIFGQTWPQNPSGTTGLVLQCRLHQKLAPQTNSKTISWQFGIRKSPPPMNR